MIGEMLAVARARVFGADPSLTVPVPVLHILDEPAPVPVSFSWRAQLARRADRLAAADWLESRARAYELDAEAQDAPVPVEGRPVSMPKSALSSADRRAIAAELRDCARDLT